MFYFFFGCTCTCKLFDYVNLIFLLLKIDWTCLTTCTWYCICSDTVPVSHFEFYLHSCFIINRPILLFNSNCLCVYIHVHQSLYLLFLLLRTALTHPSVVHFIHHQFLSRCQSFVFNDFLPGFFQVPFLAVPPFDSHEQCAPTELQFLKRQHQPWQTFAHFFPMFVTHVRFMPCRERRMKRRNEKKETKTDMTMGVLQVNNC